MLVPAVPHILYGGDYNPEQWPEELWLKDVRLMREARVNLVSVGIFSWALLEPQPGKYDFAWLDRLLNLLAEHGIMADLATATASPPAWLARIHPESLPVDARGTVLWPGSRQHFCPSSPEYREHASALVRRIAERYRNHPALAMWHVNNEYACALPACYCDISADHFRRWLRERYGTLDALNHAWGTAFWSQRYGEWEEINPPRQAPTFINPSQQLDFRRFSSDAFLECFEMERAILAGVTPSIPVTTNFMNLFKPLDYWKWASREDVVSYDSYPDPAEPDAPMWAACNYDLMRSLGKGRPWVLMEQATSQVNWRAFNPAKPPGHMRLGSYAAMARGADGVMFFQWRQSSFGAEKFHSAMVPHAGTDSRVWREVVELGRELELLDPVLGARSSARVAVVWDWENWWALETEGKPSSDLRCIDQIICSYAPLYRRNIAVDFVRPEDDLSPYAAVLVPNLYLTRPAAAENIERYVQTGGTLVMSFFSGIVDETDRVYPGPYPAPFRRMLGLSVEEVDAYPDGKAGTIRTAEGGRFACSVWSDIIRLEGAEALAWYESGYYAGLPAITRHVLGAGTAYYLGTRPSAEYMTQLLGSICDTVGVSAPLAVPPGVEVTERHTDKQSFVFVLNHGEEEAAIELTAPAPDLLTNGNPTSLHRIGPGGVAIIAMR